MTRFERLIGTGLVCGALSLAATVHAASCDYLPEAPAPAWIAQPPVTPGRQSGVGVAERPRKGDFETLREVSRQAALRDLSSSIEVTVRSSLAVEVSSRTGTKGELTQQDVKQITETTTSVALQGVTVDELWLDRKRCALWTRVSVDDRMVASARVLALQRRQLQRVMEGLATAEDSARPFDARAEGADTADALLARLDFNLLAAEADRAALAARIAAVRGPLQAQRNARERSRTLLREAEALLAQATTQTSLPLKRKAAADAAAKLKEALRLLPLGTPQAVEPDVIANRLARLEQERGNLCAAKRGYERIAEASADLSARTQARTAADAVTCSDEDEATYAWRKLFDGRVVELRCAVRNEGVTRGWDSACSRAATFLQSSGAQLVNGTSLRTPATVVGAAAALAVDPGAVPTGDAEWMLLLVADGKVNHRASTTATGKQDHQFEGGGYSMVLGAGGLEFSDSFNGVGGWNPVSGEMAIDVLGIYLLDRWKQRYLESTRGGLQ